MSTICNALQPSIVWHSLTPQTWLIVVKRTKKPTIVVLDEAEISYAPPKQEESAIVATVVPTVNSKDVSLLDILP